MAVTRESAERTAKKYLRRLEKQAGKGLRLLDKETHEAGGGWIFFYDSEEFLESGKVSHALAGNAPFLVLREDEVIITGTARPLEHYLSKLSELSREVLE